MILPSLNIFCSLQNNYSIRGLTSHVDKTERTTFARAPSEAHELWRSVRKLGSLLGGSEVINQRKLHAAIAFQRLDPSKKLARLVV